MGGSVDEAGMLTLSRLVFLPLSSERRSSFLLRLTFVMPTAKPLEIHRSVIVTWLDVIAVCPCSWASRAVVQHRFAPAGCAVTHEGAPLGPVIRQTGGAVRCLPCHARPLSPYALTPAPPGPIGAGVSTSARIAVKAEAPRLRSGPH